MLLEQTHGVFAVVGSNTRNHRVAWKTQGSHWHCGETLHNVAAVRTGCGGSEVPKLRWVLVKQRGVAKQNHPRVVRSSAKLGYRNCQGAHAAFTRKYQPGSEHITALWLGKKVKYKIFGRAQNCPVCGAFITQRIHLPLTVLAHFSAPWDSNWCVRPLDISWMPRHQTYKVI